MVDEPRGTETWTYCPSRTGQVKNLHLLMNNCYANYGTTNAREIAALLAEE